MIKENKKRILTQKGNCNGSVRTYDIGKIHIVKCIIIINEF